MTCIAPKRTVLAVARATGVTQEVVAKVIGAVFDEMLANPATVRGFGAFRYDVRSPENRPPPGKSTGVMHLPARRRLVLRTSFKPLTDAQMVQYGLRDPADMNPE